MNPPTSSLLVALSMYPDAHAPFQQVYLNQLTDPAPWRVGPPSEHARSKLVALASCPDKCSYHGWCMNERDQPSCRCFYGWRGGSCEQQREQYCPSGCQGRGLCVLGFCHCNVGFYGADCSLVKDPAGPGSKLLWEIEPTAEQLPPARPSIYVYELPTAYIRCDHIATDSNTTLPFV
jgi:hypothetical protein